MNLERYKHIKQELIQRAAEVEDKKRASYAGTGGDPLRNFSRDAELLGIDPLKALMVHMLKQVGAILSYVNNPDIEPSEPLASRAVDLINYSTLLVALAEDEGRSTGLYSPDTTGHFVECEDGFIQRLGFAGIRERGD